MSDAKHPDKKDSFEGSSLLASLGQGDATQTASKLHKDVHDSHHATPTHHTEHVNWRSELRHATTEMKQLDHLKANDSASAHKRHDLIESIDKHFQKALPAVHRDASSADSELLKNVAKATVKDNEFKDFKVNGKTMHLNSANMDAIHNAILNAPDEATRNQLTRFGALAESHKLAMHNVDESYFKTKAPMMAAMDYANFLLKHKDGVTQTKDGHTLTAGDVLNNNMSREMAHSPRGKELIKLAQDAKVDHQNALIPSEKNPMVLIHEAQTPGVDPQAAIAKLRHAVELSNDPQFKNLVNQADQTAKQAQGPDAQKQTDAVNELKHAQALSEGYLGQALLMSGNPKEATTHLLNAGQDPTGAAMLTDGHGTRTFGFAMQAAMNDSAQTMQSYKQAMADVENHTQKYKAFEQDQNSEAAAKEMKAANDSANAAVQNAQVLRGAIGDENGQKAETEFNALIEKSKKGPLSDEEKGMVGVLQPVVEARQAEAAARLTRGNLELDQKNHNAAAADLEAVQKLDPAFAADPNIKPTLDENLKKAQEGAKYDNSNWFEKRLSDVGSAAEHAWDYVKEHPKTVAVAVAVGVAAVAAGVATGGIAVPGMLAGAGALLGAGEASLAVGATVGIVSGTIGGTLAGASVEKISGQNTFYGGVKDTFLPAAGGAVLGTGIGVGLGMVGSGSEIAATNPFLANSIRGALIGSPQSLYSAAENYTSGRDKNLFAAGVDFATDEASWAIGGGLMGKTGALAKFAGPIVGVTTNVVGDSVGNYYANKTPWQSNYYTAAIAQAQALRQTEAQTQAQDQDQPGQ